MCRDSCQEFGVIPAHARVHHTHRHGPEHAALLEVHEVGDDFQEPRASGNVLASYAITGLSLSVEVFAVVGDRAGNGVHPWNLLKQIAPYLRNAKHGCRLLVGKW